MIYHYMSLASAIPIFEFHEMKGGLFRQYHHATFIGLNKKKTVGASNSTAVYRPDVFLKEIWEGREN